eukprot:SM000003S11116  [mRNA]  locus=s3:998766:1001737:- [translate_table: standard]
MDGGALYPERDCELEQEEAAYGSPERAADAEGSEDGAGTQGERRDDGPALVKDAAKRKKLLSLRWSIVLHLFAKAFFEQFMPLQRSVDGGVAAGSPYLASCLLLQAKASKTAKLKQSKLDARKQQFLSQVSFGKSRSGSPGLSAVDEKPVDKGVSRADEMAAGKLDRPIAAANDEVEQAWAAVGSDTAGPTQQAVDNTVMTNNVSGPVVCHGAQGSLTQCEIGCGSCSCSSLGGQHAAQVSEEELALPAEAIAARCKKEGKAASHAKVKKGSRVALAAGKPDNLHMCDDSTPFEADSNGKEGLELGQQAHQPTSVQDTESAPADGKPIGSNDNMTGRRHWSDTARRQNGTGLAEDGKEGQAEWATGGSDAPGHANGLDSSMGNGSMGASGSEDGVSSCGEDENGEDDWEAAADALDVKGVEADGKGDMEAEKGGGAKTAAEVALEVVEEQKAALPTRAVNFELHSHRAVLKPEYKSHPGTLGRLGRAASGRAWRPDDVTRPPTLPQLNRAQSLHIPASFTTGPQWSSPHHLKSAMWGVPPPPPSLFCPICTEELDHTDTSFVPCNCGFRLCLFCHHRIASDDGRCPGCRKAYSTEASAKLPRSSSLRLCV